MADYSDPKRATAYRFTLSLYARSDNQIKTTPTLAAGDVKVSKDNGATANITTLPTETPASSGILQVDLSATEMTADLVTVIFRDAAGAEWNDVVVNIAPSTVQMADLATAAALTVIDDLIDTEVAAIKAKTDLIPAAPAAVGDIPSAATIADAVWDEDATAHQTQGTFGQAIGDPAADTDSIWSLVNTNLDAAVSTRLASASYTAPLDAAGTRTAVGLASANLDTQLADLPTNAELATALGTADDAVLAQVALVKAKTDLIPAAPAAVGDIPSAATIADAVWDEAIAGHAVSGSTGEQLAAAGAAGDPWATALPGAYAAGTAGKIVGDNINAPIATVDTVVDAIKAKTDSLTFTVAGQVDANIQYVNDVQVNGTGAPGSEWGP